VQCELGRGGVSEDSERFIGHFTRFLSRESDYLHEGVFDSTNLETIISYVNSAKLPLTLFVPLVENPDQYIDDQGAHETLQRGLKLNLELVLSVLPLLQLKFEGEDPDPASDPDPSTEEAQQSEGDVRSLLLYALQFCRDKAWNWEPSWTNAELSDLGSAVLESLAYGKLGAAEKGTRINLDVLAAALIRKFPKLHVSVAERYSKLMMRVESQSTLYSVEDNESAFEMTVLLHTLHWLMLGMGYRSYVDEDYTLSEDLMPVILHACNSSTQSMQYCGLQCLTLLIRSAPSTVIKWHRGDLYNSLEKFLQHSETTMWSVSVLAIVGTYLALEGKDNKSEKLLDLMENLVEQGEVMIYPERYDLWFSAMGKLVPSLGALTCCFLTRILVVINHWLGLSIAKSDYNGALNFIIALVQHCWPAAEKHNQSIEDTIQNIAKRLPEKDALVAKVRKVLRKGVLAARIHSRGDDRVSYEPASVKT